MNKVLPGPLYNDSGLILPCPSEALHTLTKRLFSFMGDFYFLICDLNIMKYYTLLFIVSLSFQFCSPPCGFTSNNQYCRHGFSGKDLGDRTIGLCPLLKSQGADSSGILNTYMLLNHAVNARPDLKFVPYVDTEKKVADQWGREVLHSFYIQLFKSDMITLQTSDSLWKATGCDYYLVNRLKNGSNIKSFDNSERKKIEIEAELWDCSTNEPVWRQVVNGVCPDGKQTDAQFVKDALSRVLKEIPELLPAYDNKHW